MWITNQSSTNCECSWAGQQHVPPVTQSNAKFVYWKQCTRRDKYSEGQIVRLGTMLRCMHLTQRSLVPTWAAAALSGNISILKRFLISEGAIDEAIINSELSTSWGGGFVGQVEEAPLSYRRFCCCLMPCADCKFLSVYLLNSSKSVRVRPDSSRSRKSDERQIRYVLACMIDLFPQLNCVKTLCFISFVS